MQSVSAKGVQWAGQGLLAAMLVVGVAAPVTAESQAPAAAADRAKGSVVLVRQVTLSRAGFSVGAIDGQDGPKTRKAMAAWQAAHPGAALEPSAGATGVRAYAITDADAAGPFAPSLPSDMMALGELETLPYRTLQEQIAERFSTTARYLDHLNPGAGFAVGDTVMVPDVEPMTVPAKSEQRPAPDPASAHTAMVTVSKARNELVVTDAAGAVVFYAPVSSGSEHDPLPIGQWKVTDVFMRPLFNYNPDLFWDADPSHAKTQLPGGPNSPVGLVWIDLDKEHYGLHGTPSPETVGIAQSHGCVRLTNWDVLRLARLVKPDTPVHFEP